MNQNDRIRLLPMNSSEEEIDELFALTSNPEVARFMRFDTHTNRAQAVALAQEYFAEGSRAFRLKLADTGATIGFVAAKASKDMPEVGGLSLFLSPLYWNKGYATEITTSLLRILRDENAFHEVEAYVVGDNIGSRRVLEKLGFQEVRRLDFPDLPSGLFVYQLAI